MKKKTKYRIILLVVLVAGFLFGKDRFDPPGPPDLPEVEEAAGAASMGLDWLGFPPGSFPQVGHIVFRSDGAYFNECGSPPTAFVLVEDPSGTLNNRNREAFSERVEGQPAFASLYMRRESLDEEETDTTEPESLEATGVNYWPIEGFGCDYAWDMFGFRAFGNEPFWMLEITNGVARFSRPDNKVQTWRVETGRLPILSEDRSLEVQLVAEPCMDDMSGAWYGMQVAVSAEGSFVKGCGMAGLGSIKRP